MVDGVGDLAEVDGRWLIGVVTQIIKYKTVK